VTEWSGVDIWGSRSFAMSDASSVGEARRQGVLLAQRLGFDDERRGALAIVVSELGQNIVRHAHGRGDVLLRALKADGADGIEVVGIDRGPGIANLVEACRDGYSTGGSPGTGLGAIERQSVDFDIYSHAGEGTAIVARVWGSGKADAVAQGLEVGAVCLPKPEETAYGDAWSIVRDGGRTLVLVADGLGHGFAAAEASRAAVGIVEEHATHSPTAIVQALHAGLRATRGAAIGLAEIREAEHVLRFVGVGNIAATLLSATGTKALVSHSGTAGVEARRIQEFGYSWSDESMLVVHSDGLSANWELQRYPGLRSRDAAIVAAVLYRDHRRIRDDVTVLAIRPRRRAA
jgi:anti-sigma regulatory factor (Ser/Thr protein kinase)